MDQHTQQALLQFQQTELTESLIYDRLAALEKNPDNAAVLRRIAREEARHHDIIGRVTGQCALPDKSKIWRYTLLARLLGLTFAVKLMEGGESHASAAYRAFGDYPAVQQLAEEEDKHENELIALINEERLNYIGSVVLGLSDALVEFTGALAGFTFALQNPRLVALAGKPGHLITVVGCGGNRDKGKRPMMAREAVGGSWKAILTSDNPRHEDPQDILDDMTAGLDADERRKALVIADRREAIRTACSLAQPGDVVLVAGKGHETYQIIGDVKHHFDDKEEIRNCF